MAAHDRGDFETTVIRPWCTYGEGGTVLHTLGQGSYFLDRIRQGKPVVIHGDGQTLWGPCHRDDVARAFVNAVGNETAYGEAYHVTSEENITWGQFYGTVADVMDAPDPELVHIPTEILAEAVPDRTGMLLDHFQFSTVFDNSKARRDLDFEYTITFEEGVGALSSGWRSAAKLRTGTARTTTNLSKPGARLQGSSSIRSRSDSIGDVRYPGPERDESHSRPEKVPRTDEHRAERVGVGVQKREVARREEALPEFDADAEAYRDAEDENRQPARRPLPIRRGVGESPAEGCVGQEVTPLVEGTKEKGSVTTPDGSVRRTENTRMTVAAALTPSHRNQAGNSGRRTSRMAPQRDYPTISGSFSARCGVRNLSPSVSRRRLRCRRPGPRTSRGGPGVRSEGALDVVLVVVECVGDVEAGDVHARDRVRDRESRRVVGAPLDGAPGDLPEERDRVVDADVAVADATGVEDETLHAEVGDEVAEAVALPRPSSRR